jgi:heme A synthase
LLLAALGAQVLLGAITVWSGFAAEAKALHLSLATLVWIALITMAALIYLPRRFSAAPMPATARDGA